MNTLESHLIQIRLLLAFKNFLKKSLRPLIARIIVSGANQKHNKIPGLLTFLSKVEDIGLAWVLPLYPPPWMKTQTTLWNVIILYFWYALEMINFVIIS